MERFAAREEHNMISYETTTTQQGIKFFENNIEFLGEVLSVEHKRTLS